MCKLKGHDVVLIVKKVTEDVTDCHEEKEEVCKENVSGYSTFESCTTVPRQVCTVIRKPTKKSTPQENCMRVPRKFCYPRSSKCNIVKSEKECRDHTRVEVTEVPTEKCSVQPIPRFPKYTHE